MTFFFLSCLFGSWAAVLVYWIAGLYLRESSARAAALLVGFWPSLFLWSTQNLKEPLTVLLLLSSIFFFVVPVSGWRRLIRLAGWGTLVLLLLLNPFIGPLFWIALVVAFCLGRRFLRKIFVGVVVILILLVSTGFAREPLQQAGQYVDQLLFKRPVLELAVTPNRFAEMIEYLRQVRTWDAKTPFFGSVRLNTMSKLIGFLPVGMGAVLMAPFPWAARSSGEMLGSLEMLVWYPFLFFVLKGAWRSLAGGYGQKVIFFTFLLVCGSIALLEGNMGTLFRHRAVLWPLLLFFVASGIDASVQGVHVKEQYAVSG